MPSVLVRMESASRRLCESGRFFANLAFNLAGLGTARPASGATSTRAYRDNLSDPRLGHRNSMNYTIVPTCLTVLTCSRYTGEEHMPFPGLELLRNRLGQAGTRDRRTAGLILGLVCGCSFETAAIDGLTGGETSCGYYAIDRITLGPSDACWKVVMPDGAQCRVSDRGACEPPSRAVWKPGDKLNLWCPIGFPGTEKAKPREVPCE